MTLDLDSLLPRVAEAARQAGAAILAHYSGACEVERKADGSPVTAADRASEAVVIAALKALTPDIPIVSEEAVEAGYIPDCSGCRFWLVDPLDGTKEYVKRNGEFAVNIGLVVDLVPVAGVIYAPVLDTLYVGSGKQAWRETAGVRQQIKARAPAADGVVVAVSRSHPSARLEDYLSRMLVKSRLQYGSALKLGLVAAGDADLYPRFGRTMEWDTAAGHAIIDAAGGSVDNIEGGRLAYGKPGFANDGFIARGRAA